MPDYLDTFSEALDRRELPPFNPVLAALLTRTSAQWAVGVVKPRIAQQRLQRVCSEKVGVFEHE